MGTNADIYEAQLVPIQAQMDPTHEFVFVDGLEECRPASGVAAFFSGPFYCYYAKPTAEHLAAAYDLVREVIEEEGPFHGVFGFSQGGALAASLLLHHQKVASHEPDLFNFAVFTCASLPFDPDTERQQPKYNTIISQETGEVSVQDWIQGESEVEPIEINGFITPLEPGDITLRRYHPEREKTRIHIPTVHIRGLADPFFSQQRVLTDLCADAFVLDHDQGHQLPRDSVFAKKAASLIQGAIAKAMFRC